MSIAASAWAKRQVTGSAPRKCLLMVLADYATVREDWEPEGSDGRHFTWAGQKRLARETEMAERSIRTHLDALEEAGLIRRVVRPGDGEGRQPDVLILAVDDDGPRPFEGNRQDLPEGATGNPEQGNRQNSAGGPYIEPPSQPPTSPRTRATRIPDDFEVTDEMRAWYREKIAGAIDGQREHEKFIAHFQSASGTNARKVSWSMAWKKWMLTALDRAPRRPTSGAPAGAGQQERPRYPNSAERQQEQSRSNKDLARVAEEMVQATGSKPGDPGHAGRVVAVFKRLKAESAQTGGAPRTSMPYIEGEVVRATGAQREVTSDGTV